jgi:hypothetical protein
MNLQTSQEIEALLAGCLQAQRNIEEGMPKPSETKPLKDWNEEDMAAAGSASIAYQWLQGLRAEEKDLKHRLRLARIDEALQKLLARFPERSDSGVSLD